MLIWVGSACLLFGLFLKLTQELFEDKKVELLDQKILFFISNYRTPNLTSIFINITKFGSFLYLSLLFILVAVFLWKRGEKKIIWYLLIGNVGAAIILFSLKNFFSRIRPSVVSRLVEVGGFSYPSGHSFGATTFYLILMFISWRFVKPWRSRILFTLIFFIIILLISFSRIYLGVHYPSDVLSGFFLGVAWVIFLTSFFFRNGLSD